MIRDELKLAVPRPRILPAVFRMSRRSLSLSGLAPPVPSRTASEPRSSSAVTAELDLGSLSVLEGTGGAKPLSDKDRRDILNTAGKILKGGTARFTSTRIIPAASGGAIEGTLTLNGATRPARLQLVSRGPAQYQGTATVRQTDYGVTPYTGFFGALKLKDEVTVEVEADLTRAARE